MKEILQNISRKDLALSLCFLLVSSLFWSKYLITLAMIGLIALAVINPDLKANWKRFISNKAYLVITLLFLLILVSGLYSSNLEWWGERLRIKLPFLLLPFAFASISPFTQRQYHGLFYFMVVVCTIFTIGVGINYALHFEEINLAIKQSKAMPTPTNHIRFSLLVALSILVGGVLYYQRYYWKYAAERWLILGCTIFLMVFIHVLSVRSGLFALYAASFFLILRFTWKSRNYPMGIIILLGVTSIPFLAYKFIPSFQTKLELFVWNYKMYKEGNIKNYSDARRIISYEVGLEAGGKSPLIGLGAGDVKDEVFAIYHEKYPNLTPMLPHNQYLFIYVATGAIGLILFLGTVFYPLLYRRNYHDGFFVAFHLIVLLSFLVENTIENAVGVAFYSFFLLLGLNYLEGRRNQSVSVNVVEPE